MTDGTTHTGVNATLSAGGAVSGTVTDAGAHPLGGVTVAVVTAGGSEVGSSTTATDGTYTVTGLPAGSYDVCFDGSSATGGSSTTGYLDQCYHDVAWDGNYSDITGMTTVPVTTGSTHTGVGASLAVAGAVSGTVTDTGAHPLGGVSVTVVTTSGSEVGFATTASDGTYAVPDLATGSYDVCFDGSTAVGGSATAGYLDQCYDAVAWDGNLFDVTGATAVAVTVGSTHTGVDASLVTGGEISGTVTDGGSHPLGGVVVQVFTSTGSQVGSASTGSDGTYLVTGLLSGSYDVCFVGSAATGGSSVEGYLDQCYNGVAWDGNPFDVTGATTVAVTVGTTRPGVDGTLPPAGAVSGTVTDTGAHALEGVSVDVYTTDGSQVGFATTASDGTYTVAGLASGSYDVCFDGSSTIGGSSTTGYLLQCYDGVAWDGSSSDTTGATVVPVAVGSTRTGVDASLSPGAAVSGLVTDSRAHPLDGVSVEVIAPGGTQSFFATTGSDGTYTVDGLVAGSYDVCFDGSSATGGSSTTGYLDQCYSGVAWDGDPLDTTGATAVTLTAGSTHGSVGAPLPSAGAVSGTVTDTGAHPLDGVSVSVVTASGSQVGYATTASDGTFTVPGLAAGSYDVCFDGSSATGGSSTTGYLDQCWNGVSWDGNTSDITGATAVTVTTGATHSGVGASLPAGGAVDGAVTDTGSHPLGGVDVEVFNGSGVQVGSASTAPDGTYALTGLPTGTFDVCFDGSNASGGTSAAGYLDQCYAGSAWNGIGSDITGATSVTVTAGSSRAGVGASLVASAAVSGTVTDTGDHPLAGAFAFVLDDSGAEMGGTITGADGTYTVGDLPAGSYHVCFDVSGATGGTSTTGYVDQCWNDVSWDGVFADATSATAVPVVAGAVAVGVDAAAKAT